MKQTLPILLIAVVFFTACTKEKDLIDPPVIAESCLLQTDNPSGRSYINDSLVITTTTKKSCGFLPLSTKSYWVYQDSLFTDGIFSRVKMDTLRFTKTYQSRPDQLTWWQTNIEIGLPDLLYSNDSAIFAAEFRLFAQDPIRDVKKEYGQFSGDSIQYLTSFEDNAAIGKSIKCNNPVVTTAGTYSDCILFEKKAPFFRKDQVFFKPGFGVVKYTCEEAPMGSPVMKIKQISTLVSFHIE